MSPIEDAVGAIAEDDYSEESNAWGGAPPGPEDRGPWAGDICGACGQEFTSRTEYRKHLREHREMSRSADDATNASRLMHR